MNRSRQSRLVQLWNSAYWVRVLITRSHELGFVATQCAVHIVMEKWDGHVFKKSRWLSSCGYWLGIDADWTVLGAVAGSRGHDPRPETASRVAAFGRIRDCCPAWRNLLRSSRYRPLQFR